MNKPKQSAATRRWRYQRSTGFTHSTWHMTNVSVASWLDALETADPTNRSKSSPVPPRLPKEPSTWYLGPLDNPSQQDWLVLVPTAQPKRHRVYWKLIRLKEADEFGGGGGCHTSVFWLGLLELRKRGISSRFAEKSWPLSISPHESRDPPFPQLHCRTISPFYFTYR